MTTVRPFSLALDLDGTACLVVGGGPIAARRCRRLLRSGAEVTVVAPEMVAELRESQARLVLRRYEPGDVEGMTVVITATGDDDVDAAVVRDARAAGAVVNDASQPRRGTFMVPAEATAGPVTVTVNTSGESPALSRWLRDRIEADLRDGYPLLVEIMAGVRAEMVAADRPTEHPGWSTALDSGLLELVREGRLLAAKDRLRAHLGLDEQISPA
ncbi:MAG: precorrin-2 dehydrogenase/sirohydrochlorin ferrochelatase family protein [Acidimicrobiales bacterium]